MLTPPARQERIARMPSRAAARRLGLAALLCALFALLGFLVWREIGQPLRTAATTRPTPRTYMRYTFSLDVAHAAAGPWHPGQEISLLWQPQVDQNLRVEGPTPAVCTVALYGPYPSLDAAGRAENALVGAASVATATAVAGTTLALAGPRLTLNDFTSTAQPYALQLPATLAPGYYVLDGREVDAWGSTGVGIVVEVTPATS
jgi:hypothetical protein